MFILAGLTSCLDCIIKASDWGHFWQTYSKKTCMQIQQFSHLRISSLITALCKKATLWINSHDCSTVLWNVNMFVACKRLWADLQSKARLRQRALIQGKTMVHWFSHNKHLACDTACRPRSSTESGLPCSVRKTCTTETQEKDKLLCKFMFGFKLTEELWWGK